MTRRRKLFSYRKPKLKVTKKGLKVTKPSARIGGKTGVNFSSKGVSLSTRTKLGTASSTRVGVRGFLNNSCSSILLLGILLIGLVVAIL